MFLFTIINANSRFRSGQNYCDSPPLLGPHMMMYLRRAKTILNSDWSRWQENVTLFYRQNNDEGSRARSGGNSGKVSVLWHVRHALSGCRKVLWEMRPKEMNPGASFLNLGLRVRRGITAHVFESHVRMISWKPASRRSPGRICTVFHFTRQTYEGTYYGK